MAQEGLILTESQLASPGESQTGEGSPRGDRDGTSRLPGLPRTHTMSAPSKGVGRIYQQTFPDIEPTDLQPGGHSPSSTPTRAPSPRRTCSTTEWFPYSTSRASGCCASSPTGAPSTAESRRTMPTSCTWQWRTSTTPGPRPITLRPTGFGTVPQDPAGRMLQPALSKEALPHVGRAAGGPGRLAGQIQ